MGAHEEAKVRVKAVYEAAADRYDDQANSFWERFGRRTVERLELEPGARVFDACCGSGASALPAAEAVGPEGSVVGVDLSESLLALAREKAHQRGLANVDFRCGDLLDPPHGSATFDAVVCVFGVFFVPDMAAAVRALWSRVRPGGKLAVTTWGERVFEPGDTLFWESVRAVRPDLYKSFNPWDRISRPTALRELLREGGVERSEAVVEPGTHPIRGPDDWWTLVLGTGYRGIVEQLSDGDRARVREANLAFFRDRGPTAVSADTVYAVARR